MTPAQLPVNLTGDPLVPKDLDELAQRWITPEIAAAALLRRVDSLHGAELVGRNGKGDYSGIAIPYLWPDENRVRDYRLRRDFPDLEYSLDGQTRPTRKYLSPPGRGNMLYLPPGVAVEWLADASVPIVITEGEFKTLALWRLSEGTFLPVGLSGAWNWRGVVGKVTDSTGKRQDAHGVVPDISRIHWADRTVTIVFDSDLASNLRIVDARRRLTVELEHRGAIVYHFKFPDTTCKGIDDFLYSQGADVTRTLLAKARRVTRAKPKATVIPIGEGLICGEKGPYAIVANAITLLRSDPEWDGVLAYNEFADRMCFQKHAPWGPANGFWQDQHEVLTANWLQHHAVRVPSRLACEAAYIVSRDRCFHPLREYLESLIWDGTPRIRRWLQTYLGVEDEENSLYVQEVGSKWLISGVARILSPGCKADCCLILEGPQGKFKSTAIQVLGGEWFRDQISDIGTKDSKMEIAGVWIIEIGELAALGRAEINAVKTFMSSGNDHYRPAYGHTVIDRPRQTIFAGTHNPNGRGYLKDETGARRFWPVVCGEIDIPALTADRNQLWAEATALYHDGAPWWLEGEAASEAEIEQGERLQTDLWDDRMTAFVAGRTSVTLIELLQSGVGITDASKLDQSAQNRAAAFLVARKWTKLRRGARGERQYIYYRPNNQR